MNVSFQKKSEKSTNEWYTPRHIIEPLGDFDLDPATCEKAISRNHSAANYYTKEDNGLEKEWFGRVWLNPPYSNPDIKNFMRNIAEHNNGIALVFNRCDSGWFHEYVLNKADSLFFMRKRIKFIDENGVEGKQPGCGSVLVAYGKENSEYLRNYPLEGKFIKL